MTTAALSAAAIACQEKMISANVNENCIALFLQQHKIISSTDNNNNNSGVIRESDIHPVKSLDRLEDIIAAYHHDNNNNKEDNLKRRKSEPQQQENNNNINNNNNNNNELLHQTVMLKLNGGLGTGMGLRDAKTLLKIKKEKTFLHLTAEQVQYIRQQNPNNNNNNNKLKFMLLNSFSTKDSTREFFQQHFPELYKEYDAMELVQNQVPKIYAEKNNNNENNNHYLFPASWPKDPKCEWCPPGHGDIYTVLYSSGKLHQLIHDGYQYLFVSNGDNLGATLQEAVLKYMKEKQLGFLMEVCERTESDKKGGHLAEWNTNNNNNNKTGFLLRESAQCAPEDEKEFQNIQKHRFFNTNNLWIHLLTLLYIMEQEDNNNNNNNNNKNIKGTLSLPIIRNKKTVDPTDSASPKVLQLETAMGAAIELFNQNNNNNNGDGDGDSAPIYTKSGALIVPRQRFAPVKTCSDLFLLRSDAYELKKDFRLELHPACHQRPPVIDLDSRYYKLLEGFETLFDNSNNNNDEDDNVVPSLKECLSLTIKGKVKFEKNVVIKGNVVIENTSDDECYVVKEGTVLENQEIKI